MNSNWSYSPETAKLGLDLCDLDLWPWPFAWTSCLSLVITPENFMMIWWWEHSEKGVTDRRTDGQTDLSVLRAAWSQLKMFITLIIMRQFHQEAIVWHERDAFPTHNVSMVTVSTLWPSILLSSLTTWKAQGPTAMHQTKEQGKLEQLERLCSEDTPRHPMITHTIPSYWIPRQNKTKSKIQIKRICQKFKFSNFEINFTRDTPSGVAW